MCVIVVRCMLEMQSGPTVPYGMLASDSLGCKCDTVQKIRLSLFKNQIALRHTCTLAEDLFFFFFFLHADIHNAPMKALSKQKLRHAYRL